MSSRSAFDGHGRDRRRAAPRSTARGSLPAALSPSHTVHARAIRFTRERGSADGRFPWVAGLKLPAAAREQLTIALELIDAIDIQLGRVDVALRAYARKQPGCRTLIDAIYGIGELTSVTILAELGDPRRFQNSRDAVRYSGLDITVHQSDARRSRGISPARPTGVALGVV